MQPDSPKSEEFINEFKNYQCDVLLVVAYGHILTEELLETPQYGSVNIHASFCQNTEEPHQYKELS